MPHSEVMSTPSPVSQKFQRVSLERLGVAPLPLRKCHLHLPERSAALALHPRNLQRDPDRLPSERHAPEGALYLPRNGKAWNRTFKGSV